MDENITDLDALVPPAKRVKFDGQVYLLPGDMPLETYLRINALGQAEAEGRNIEQAIEDTLQVIVDLFCREAPPEANIDKGKLYDGLKGRGFEFVMKLMQHVYPVTEEAEAEAPPEVDADVPPPSPEDGTTSGTT